MKKEYTFYHDPGHGWLAVPIEDIRDLGLVEKISGYSYPIKKGGVLFIYLEEDCDAHIFGEAAKAAGWELEVKEHYLENFNRNRNGYSAEMFMEA